MRTLKARILIWGHTHMHAPFYELLAPRRQGAKHNKMISDNVHPAMKPATWEASCPGPASQGSLLPPLRCSCSWRRPAAVKRVSCTACHTLHACTAARMQAVHAYTFHYMMSARGSAPNTYSRCCSCHAAVPGGSEAAATRDSAAIRAVPAALAAVQHRARRL